MGADVALDIVQVINLARCLDGHGVGHRSDLAQAQVAGGAGAEVDCARPGTAARGAGGDEIDDQVTAVIGDGDIAVLAGSAQHLEGTTAILAEDDGARGAVHHGIEGCEKGSCVEPIVAGSVDDNAGAGGDGVERVLGRAAAGPMADFPAGNQLDVTGAHHGFAALVIDVVPGCQGNASVADVDVANGYGAIAADAEVVVAFDVAAVQLYIATGVDDNVIRKDDVANRIGKEHLACAGSCDRSNVPIESGAKIRVDVKIAEGHGGAYVVENEAGGSCDRRLHALSAGRSSIDAPIEGNGVSIEVEYVRCPL